MPTTPAEALSQDLARDLLTERAKVTRLRAALAPYVDDEVYVGEEAVRIHEEAVATMTATAWTIGVGPMFSNPTRVCFSRVSRALMRQKSTSIWPHLG